MLATGTAWRFRLGYVYTMCYMFVPYHINMLYYSIDFLFIYIYICRTYVIL